MRYEKLLGFVLVFALSALSFGQTGYGRVRRGAPKTTGITGAHTDLAGTFHGTLKELTNKEIAIQNEEEQTVTIRRSRKTKFLKDGKEIKASEIAMNTAVSVDATEDVDLKPTALTVTVDPPLTPKH